MDGVVMVWKVGGKIKMKSRKRKMILFWKQKDNEGCGTGQM